MKKAIYERKGIGEDWFTHHWFCDMLLSAKLQMENQQYEDAEYTIALASLFALERMHDDALADSLSVLAKILDKRGTSLREYLGYGQAA
jgi:hypothetical protein